MNDAHVVARELLAAAKTLGPAFETKVFEGVGLKLKPDIGKAVAHTSARKGSLSDQSMSGWRRGAPLTIDGRYDIKDGDLVMSPSRRATGPMRVLEDGRSAYAAGSRRRTGSRLRKRTGERVETTRLVKGTVAGTKGKGTWTVAVSLMEKDAPALVEKAVAEAVGKVLRG